MRSLYLVIIAIAAGAIAHAHTFREGWNNKGLIDQQGRKKKAFYVLKAYYNGKAG